MQSGLVAFVLCQYHIRHAFQAHEADSYAFVMLTLRSQVRVDYGVGDNSEGSESESESLKNTLTLQPSHTYKHILHRHTYIHGKLCIYTYKYGQIQGRSSSQTLQFSSVHSDRLYLRFSSITLFPIQDMVTKCLRSVYSAEFDKISSRTVPDLDRCHFLLVDGIKQQRNKCLPVPVSGCNQSAAPAIEQGRGQPAPCTEHE